MGNKQILYSRPLSEEGKDGETPIYRSRNLEFDEDLISTMNGITDLKTLYIESFKLNRNNPCIGTREKTEEEVVDEETKETKIEVKYGKYMYMTYGQVHEFSECLAKSIYKNDL